MARKIVNMKDVEDRYYDIAIAEGLSKPDAVAEAKKKAHAEWVALRKSSIGGSDAAVCVNMNPYSDLLTLYADKKDCQARRKHPRL